MCAWYCWSVGAASPYEWQGLQIARGGAFDPSWISHRTLGLGPDDERMYSRLNKLLLPTQLRPFVGRHPEFSWQVNGRRGMIITWASPAAAGRAPFPTLPSPSSHAPTQYKGPATRLPTLRAGEARGVVVAFPVLREQTSFQSAF